MSWEDFDHFSGLLEFYLCCVIIIVVISPTLPPETKLFPSRRRSVQPPHPFMQISVLIYNHSSENQKCIQLFRFYLSFSLFSVFLAQEKLFQLSSRPKFFSPFPSLPVHNNSTRLCWKINFTFYMLAFSLSTNKENRLSTRWSWCGGNWEMGHPQQHFNEGLSDFF